MAHIEQRPDDTLAAALHEPVELVGKGESILYPGFRPGELRQPLATVHAPEAAPPRAAERQVREDVVDQVIVDQHAAHIQLARDAARPPAIARPDTGVQTIDRLVGEVHSLLIVRDRHDRQHGTERLFSHQLHLVAHTDDDGGSVEVAGPVDLPATQEDPGAA